MFGFIDSLKLPVEESLDQDIENAMYNGWLHDHYISNILVFGPDGAHFFRLTHTMPVTWDLQELSLHAVLMHPGAGTTRESRRGSTKSCAREH